MGTSPNLLKLPPEIRDQIWAHVFNDLHIDPFKGACSLNTDCSACFWTSRPEITPHARAVAPLLTCKQIYNEARSLCYDNMTVHISSYTALSAMHVSSSRNTDLNNSVHRLTLYTHLEAENRFEWFAELLALSSIFPNLERMAVHSHMRPPKSYDNLIDAAYLLGPLIHLPLKIRPSNRRAQNPPPSKLDSNPSAADPTPQLPQIPNNVSNNINHHHDAVHIQSHPSTQSRDQDQDQDPNLPNYASSDLNPNFSITFKYSTTEILFDSPFIGAISTDDAIEEHEAVLRDCLADAEFRSMAEARDLNGMTMALLDIAREHEQIWLQGLHRRRMGTDFIETEIMGMAGDEFGENGSDYEVDSDAGPSTVG